MTSSPVNNLSRFQELDVYTQLDILDELDFIGLLNLAETNIHFRDLIAEHYMQGKFRLHEKLITIKPLAASADLRANNNVSSIQISEDQIIFNEANEIFQLLRNFGSMLIRLELNGVHSNDFIMLEIAKHVKTHCLSSLQEIALRQLNTAIISNWIEPFPSVHSVTIENIKNYHNIAIDLMFPMVERLDVKIQQAKNSTFLARHFEHLTHLTMTIGVMYTENPAIESILLANPQLISFHTWHYLTAQTATLLSRQCPKLESLGLANSMYQSYGTEENPIIFPRVQDFTLKLFNSDQDDPRTFPFKFQKLQSLTLLARWLPDDWVEFILVNNELEHLSIPWVDPTYDQLKRIVEALPSLNTIEIALSEERNATPISRFLNEDSQLNTVKISAAVYSAYLEVIENVREKWSLFDKWVERKGTYDQTVHLTLKRNN